MNLVKNTSKLDSAMLLGAARWACKREGVPLSKIHVEFSTRRKGASQYMAPGRSRVSKRVGAGYSLRVFVQDESLEGVVFWLGWGAALIESHIRRGVWGDTSRGLGGARRAQSAYKRNRSTLIPGWKTTAVPEKVATPAVVAREAKVRKRKTHWEKELAAAKKRVQVAEKKLKEYQNKVRYYDKKRVEDIKSGTRLAREA